MNSVPSRAETLFTEALALTESERNAFLALACGDDIDLLAQLGELLAAHESTGNFLEGQPPLRPEIPEEKAGDTIGRYRLIEKLGEGGCGAVWAAEQREPMKRRVALKIIKLGMDTRQVIARFEGERQALAMMEHPHIAKILDAGATET